jgi:hypothetical protein
MSKATQGNLNHFIFMHRIFFMEFQSSQNKQIHRVISKKTVCGPDLPGTGRGEADPAQIRPRRAGDADSNG